MANNNKTLIKWIGVKRTQADEIVSYFPKHIETYYEPFLGSGAVMKNLMSTSIDVKHYVVSDLCSDLIEMWKLVMAKPDSMFSEYSKRYEEMMSIENNESKGRDKYYYSIRDRYNLMNHDIEHIHDFFYLMNACFYGLPRWNKSRKFNSPFSIRKNSISPKNLEPILEDWTSALNSHDVQFRCCSYESVMPSKGDYIYMDPPYSKVIKGIYTGGVEPEDFMKYVKKLSDNGIKYSFSYDGYAGGKDFTYDVPKELYDKHIYVSSAASCFRQLAKKDKTAKVADSLYIRG